MRLGAVGPSGRVYTYALLDSGATISLVDSSVARKIGLRGVRTDVSIEGFGNSELHGRYERVAFKLQGHVREIHIEHALAIPTLNLPRQSLTQEIVDKVSEQEKIFINAYKEINISIIIGQDNWPLIEILESRNIHNSGLVLSRTVLGWAVHGYIKEKSLRMETFGVFTGCEGSLKTQEDERLDLLIEHYFKLENLGVSDKVEKVTNHERASRILANTSRKIGHVWETGLIWNADVIPAVDSESTARIRLHSLEKKLDQNSQFASLYYKEMDRLLSNGYAKKVDAIKKDDKIWYLPHFGVQNPNKPGKVRLVFDAAARTKGVSLNDLLDTGPDLLESLLGVLLRFRQYSYAVKADIKDMYLRVKMIKRDRGAQRFLWRGADRSRPPDTYEMTCLVFGSKSSPSSALYVKNKNADMFSQTKPTAAKSIKVNSYMDDYLRSGKSREEMRELIRDVILINNEANFAMHGWAANDDEVVKDICQENKLETNVKASLCDENERVLGLYWDRATDCFSFNVGLKKMREELRNGSVKPTKREVLSAAMSLYDPLGILSAFSIRVKILMQDIWRSGVNWKSQIRDEEFEIWKHWLIDLQEMSNVKVPRCFMNTNANPMLTQLHVFCDASLQAYSAVAYLRVVNFDSRVNLSLIMAKSRVAPLKPMTVPRLELNAALLAAKLAKTIEKELEIAIVERFFWSDSTTVLHWIKSDPRKRHTFVANRLSDINELTRTTEWRWVSTKENVADDATRITRNALKNSSRWFTGPDFLKLPSELWPKQKALDKEVENEINNSEKRKEIITTVSVREITIPTCIKLFGWHGLINFAKRIKKFADKWVNKALGNRSTSIFYAEEFWFREIQHTCFAREIDQLKSNKELSKGSKIIDLNPFIDENGLLHARGRVSRVAKEVFENQPIILDACHFATKLLIKSYHTRFYHSNNESIVNELRQQFYIIGLRSRLRWLAKKCITCRLRRGQPQIPQMADLPPSRLAYGLRPFTHCGVDYFGPMLVKIGRRHEKRWGVLFTCMVTRAVHLELASTLNASSTIMALMRLASRRGYPRFVYSDNGSNFTKANKELRDAIQEVETKEQEKLAALRKIKWKFNPPDAPHMGGAWERLIRSVKAAMKYALNEKVPAEEVLITVLVEIEHMVNSRPLTHVSTEPSDQEALTPNHFLIGSSSGYLKLDRYEIAVMNPRKHFETAQNIANGFWKRWLKEYLPTLLPRRKWHGTTPRLCVGDIVQIIDYQTPRNEWRVGKISEVLPGADGVVRVAKIQVGGREFIRPVHKLIKIFADQEV